MAVNYQITDQTLHISLSGFFNFAVNHQFRAIYEEADKINQIVIDLAEIEAIDSSGLGILLYLHKHFGLAKDSVQIINCNPIVFKAFQVAQFYRLFAISR